MFEWPTIELFDLKVARSMTAATKTGPFIELGVTMWVPSGDQLWEGRSARAGVDRFGESSRWPDDVGLGSVLEGLGDAGVHAPVGRTPDLEGVVVGLQQSSGQRKSRVEKSRLTCEARYWPTGSKTIPLTNPM